MTLQVAIDAMHADAKKWRELSEVTGKAAKTVEGFHPNEAQMSWAAAEFSLMSTYDELRTKAMRLLNEATTHLRLVGITLDEVGDSYERSDREAAALFDDLWEPRR